MFLRSRLVSSLREIVSRCEMGETTPVVGFGGEVGVVVRLGCVECGTIFFDELCDWCLV